MELLTFFIVWLLLCAAVGGLANSRGRSGIGFFLLSFFFSPLLGLIVVLVMKDLHREAEERLELRKQEERQEAERKRSHEAQLESLRAMSSSAVKVGAGPVGAPASVADEIRKLGQLRSEGLLTDQEFQAQKSALLAGGHPPALATTLPAATAVHAPTVAVKMGACSNCRATIPVDSVECPKCRALYGPGSVWKVDPL